MRYLAIGDIHGCFGALKTLAAFVPFGPDDILITLGDYVDRGPDSCAVVDWLITHDDDGHVQPLRGNHEIMMLDARLDRDKFDRWFGHGGDAALRSYSPFGEGDAGSLTDVPDAHWSFLQDKLLPWFETDEHFFVHANAYSDLPLAEQPDYMLYWEKFDHPPPHESGKIMVCGHTPQASGRPLDIGHAICIDTQAYKPSGWLTCLDVASGRYWQANQQGEKREGWLQG